MTAATARWFCLGAAILFLASLLRALGTLVVVPLMITASVCWISGALNLAQSDTPVVRTATFGAFGLRWVLALLLYWASLYHWPLLPSLQVGNGFWYFCMDALNYHAWAPRIMTSLAWGLPVPNPGATIDYYIVIAATYAMFGVSPLTAIAFNILAWTLATVCLAGLFKTLTGRTLPSIPAVIISFWPSGLIWPTQLMKDSLVAFLIVLAAWTTVLLTRSRSIRRLITMSCALMLVLVPLLRLRIYDGRILFASSMVAAAFGAVLWLCGRHDLARSVILAVVAAAIAAIGVSIIGVPDLMFLLSPSHPAASYRRYGEALAAVGDVSGAQQAYSLADSSERAIPMVGSDASSQLPRGAGVQPPRALSAVLARLARAAAAGAAAGAALSFNLGDAFTAFAPDQIGAMRQKSVATGGSSAVAPSNTLTGWRALVRMGPAAVATGVLAPFPWDIFRPRGVTGAFRTFAVSESLALYCLLPAIVVGLLRIRRPEEFFVAALAIGGLVASSLVINNLGTLFRLRAAFLLILVAFSAYGWDAYAAVLRRFRGTPAQSLSS